MITLQPKLVIGEIWHYQLYTNHGCYFRQENTHRHYEADFIINFTTVGMLKGLWCSAHEFRTLYFRNGEVEMWNERTGRGTAALDKWLVDFNASKNKLTPETFSV